MLGGTQGGMSQSFPGAFYYSLVFTKVTELDMRTIEQ